MKGFEMQITLIVTLLVGMIVIAVMSNYLTMPTVTDEIEGKSAGLGGNSAAYFALKTFCSGWGQHISACPDEACDECDNCKNAFVDKWNKYYQIPYQLYASGLVIVGPDGDLIANPKTALCAESDGRTEGSPCYNAVLCAGALKILLCEPGEECGAKIQSTDYATAVKMVQDKIEGGLAGKIKNDYAPACALVCRNVKSKADNCAISAQQCANEAVSQTMP